MRKLKVALIGAGSVSFALGALHDIVLSKCLQNEVELEIAHAMEKLCPDAWLLNYTNPEAKLVEAISKLTKIKVVGLCHGLDIGIDQLSEFLEIDKEHIGVEGGGLNHFGFFTKIWDKRTGEDLYPLFKEKEKKANSLAQFEHVGLARTMYHIYGYYPYPGTNHCGEYVSYASDFYAGLPLQFRYEPVKERLWQEDSREADFVYCASGRQLDRGLFEEGVSQENWTEESYRYDKEKVQISNEYAIPIIESIYFDDEIELNSANMLNNGAIAGLPDDMVVETQVIVNGSGIEFKKMENSLPNAIIGTINIQGSIHKLLMEAYLEKSKTKLLQAILLDPQAPSYYQACAMIDEICELQKDILPELEWK